MARKTHTRDLIQTELLSTLHGVGRDAAGQDYENAAILADLLTVAERVETQTGMFTPIFCVTGNLRWCNSTRMCEFCHAVMARGQSKMCGGCRVAHYCSVECQKKDWGGERGHRKRCCFWKEHDTVVKGLDAIERIIMEKGTNEGESDAYDDSALHRFMVRRNIEADTFMAIPVQGRGTKLTELCDGKPDKIGIAFFKSEKVLEFLRKQFHQSVAVAGNKSEDTTKRKEYKEYAKRINQQIRMLTHENPGQLSVMGSFDQYELAVKPLRIIIADPYLLSL